MASCGHLKTVGNFLCSCEMLEMLQGLDLIMDTSGISQFLVYVHEHRDIIPDLTDPYGLFSYRVLGPKDFGKLDTKVFNMKDNLYKALSKKELKCRANDNDDTKEPRYEGGISPCIESKKSGVRKYYAK